MTEKQRELVIFWLLISELPPLVIIAQQCIYKDFAMSSEFPSPRVRMRCKKGLKSSIAVVFKLQLSTEHTAWS